MQLALMIVYISTTDYYVAPMVQKEWHYRDGIEGALGGGGGGGKAFTSDSPPPLNIWRNTWPPYP